MSQSYDAVLSGNCLEWRGRAPADDRPKAVKVIVPDDEDTAAPEERRGAALAALQEIASRGGIRSIPDPVAWQREVRKDRPLPGRDE
ncbi:MAG TPA: hypothetical protein VF092_19215 [Longimicrobium sp.]